MAEFSPGFKVLLNGEELCLAGGPHTRFLSGSVVAATEGPIALTVHGLLGNQGDETKHVIWIDQTVSLGDDICFELTNIQQSSPAKKKNDPPERVMHSDLSCSVRLNDVIVCNPNLVGLDQIQLTLKWSREEESCELDVGSVSWEVEDFARAASKNWLMKKLTTGDKVSVRFQGNVVTRETS